MSDLKDKKIFFNDPRLGMTLAGRMLVRITSFSFQLILFILTFVFLISEIDRFRWIGVLLLFYWIDKFMHYKNADYSIEEVLNKKEINLARVLKPSAFHLVEKIYDKSLISKKNFYIQLAFALLKEYSIQNSLRRLDIPYEEFRQKLEELEERSSLNFESQDLNLKIENLMQEAFLYALEHNNHFITKNTLFIALFKIKDKEKEIFENLLNIFNIDVDKISKAILFEEIAEKFSAWSLPSALGAMISGGRKRIRHRYVNRAWTSRPTPILDKFSIDLTDLARENQIGFMIGHQDEYERLVTTLSRIEHPNALLVGDVGIGKETIIRHLAYNLAYDKVPKELFDKRLVELHLSLLVAGASENEIQKRLALIVDEILQAGNIILVIPEIHNLVKTSGQAYLSAADALLPIIHNNAFPIIGTTYPREFKQLIEPRSDFLNIFEVINVSEITPEEAEKILIYESLILEKEHKVFISFDAVSFAVKLAKKYFHNKFLPSSAEEILKTAISEANLRGEKFIGKDEIIRVVEQKSSIPVHEAEKEEAQKLLNLEDLIHKELIDQDEAVLAVSDALRQFRAGLSRKSGPIASFLFVGPTGVGKTELAKILAKIQFGSKDNMIRFDMSEYQTKESIYRFIGSPDGSLQGEITEAVLHKPYSLILLDEFEKAHPDILNLFLQVLDDGRLTDNLNRTIDFTNTIIIATSNAHADIVLESLKAGKSALDVANYLKERLVDVFKPELLNRFSKIVVFRELSFDDVCKIAKLNLKEIIESLKEKGIKIDFDDSAIKLLARFGYDPAFGARPLRRAIEEKIKSPLSKEILAKNIVSGDNVLVSVEGEKFIFNVLK
jgi:ATP-dependent Clp protease ATP-binding subunit ClpC